MSDSKRRGPGRPKGAKDRATREHGATIGELARRHTAVAINALVSIATAGASEAAKVSAAAALLDRGYGKPPQAIEHTGRGGGPIQHEQVIGDADAFTRAVAGLAARAGAAGEAGDTQH